MNVTSPFVMFISGALVMGYAVAALYFLKYWRRTHDRLFAFFAAAFVLLLVQRVALAMGGTSIDALWYYVLRLVAFVLIGFGIVEKNRSSRD